MVLDPLFLIIALLSIGKKLESVYIAWKEKNNEKTKVELFFLLLMVVIFLIIYIVVNWLQKLS